eukprot:251091-Amphidinium_carterae.1
MPARTICLITVVCASLFPSFIDLSKLHLLLHQLWLAIHAKPFVQCFACLRSSPFILGDKSSQGEMLASDITNLKERKRSEFIALDPSTF